MDDSEKEYVDLSKEYVNFIRFSYKVTSLYDAAANFIQNVAAGKDMDEEMQIIEVTFERQFCVCLKCGRNLIRSGAPCMNCQSKDKLISKLIAYILPYKKKLLFCLVLSVFTTAMSLVPPYMTKTLVDTVLPNGRKDMLLGCVLALLSTYLLQYGIGAVRSYNLKITGDRIVADLRNDVYMKAQHLPMRFYDRTSTGAVINRISGDTSTLQAFMLRVTQEVVVQFFLLIGMIVIMFSMNWLLALCSLIPVPGRLLILSSSIVLLVSRSVLPHHPSAWV